MAGWMHSTGDMVAPYARRAPTMVAGALVHSLTRSQDQPVARLDLEDISWSHCGATERGRMADAWARANDGLALEHELEIAHARAYAQARRPSVHRTKATMLARIVQRSTFAMRAGEAF